MGFHKSPGLQVYINDIATLINSAPQIMLLFIDLHKDFIDVEGITITLMFLLQSPGV